ncbi:RseA family anti-sigma factor [Yanghanlia caeni]|uniref:Sigma-E factor negative regulatory protein n=1 Tax=Yanghanlia caeni TaxID=3064283 RepID=A0ABU1D3U0_9BURK|nr:sigma-E factor negative regulatory protein [Alcaligenaceae bacterium LG-2]NGR07519.1 sigma-E factor negative regulatory protein [bacterium SGD-2]HZH55660.1 sigma-E factor negative regulatory protein [Burkholderiaceae bacterium]
MHAKEHDQQASLEASISAWIDAEADIRPEDLDSPYGRQVWDTYHLIGDVLRSEELAIRPSDFLYARISRAIDEEPPIVAPHALSSRRYVRAGLSGLAIAAAVAAVAWVALPQILAVDEPAAEAPVLAAGEPEGMHDYVAAHRDITGVGPVRLASFGDGR